MATFLHEMTPGFIAAVIADLFNEHGKEMLGDEIATVGAAASPEIRDWQTGVTTLAIVGQGRRMYRIDVTEVDVAAGSVSEVGS